MIYVLYFVMQFYERQLFRVDVKTSPNLFMKLLLFFASQMELLLLLLLLLANALDFTSVTLALLSILQLRTRYFCENFGQFIRYATAKIHSHSIQFDWNWFGIGIGLDCFCLCFALLWFALLIFLDIFRIVTVCCWYFFLILYFFSFYLLLVCSFVPLFGV